MILTRKMVKLALLFLLNLSLIKCRKGKFEGFIVQGQNADIRNFSHSTFLYISGGPIDGDWICGGSILNQDLVLTAAHCIYGVRPFQILVGYGHEDRHRGHYVKPFEIIIHNLYDDDDIEWDIGIMKLNKPIVFGVNVGRVAIMPYPPHGMATVAGWGNLDDSLEDDGRHGLQHTQQWVSNRTVCQHMIGGLPVGTICGGYFNERSFPARGDSGSALVVRNYIQIGIVSFKRMEVSRSIVVYSDVGYFFNWIKNHAYNLCVLKREADARHMTKYPAKDTSESATLTEDEFVYQMFPDWG